MQSGGFQAEAALAPWDSDVVDGAVRAPDEVSRSPFAIGRVMRVVDGALEIVETVENMGGHAVDAMWVHHPAFGAPFLSEACTVETAARRFIADDLRDIPADGKVLDRFGYLTDFERGWASITNSGLGLRAELEWDASVMPHAWFGVEARATPGYPWSQQASVFAIEPATSYPGHGVETARSTKTALTFEPGSPRTGRVRLAVSAVEAS